MKKGGVTGDSPVGWGSLQRSAGEGRNSALFMATGRMIATGRHSAKRKPPGLSDGLRPFLFYLALVDWNVFTRLADVLVCRTENSAACNNFFYAVS